VRILGRMLQIIGLLSFVVGVIAAVYVYRTAEDDRLVYEYAKHRYATVYSNGETQAEYIEKRQLYLNDWTFIVLAGGLGIFCGIAGIGTGTIIRKGAD